MPVLSKVAKSRLALVKRIIKIIFWGENIPQKIMHFYVYMILTGAVLLYLPITMHLPTPPDETSKYFKVVADDYFVPGKYSGLAQRAITETELTNFFNDSSERFYYPVKDAPELASRVYVIKDGISGAYKAIQIDHYSFWDAVLMSASAFTDTGITPLSIRDTYTGFGQAVLMVLVQVGGIGFVVICFFIWKIFLSRKKNNNAFSQSIILAAERGNSKIGGTAKTIVVSVAIIFVTEMIFTVIFAIYFAFVPAHELMIMGSVNKTNINIDSKVVENISRIAVDNPNQMIYVYQQPIAIWAAFVHSLSAINNAGFDILGANSLTAYRNDYHAVFLFLTTVEAFIGGIGYPVLFELYERAKFKKQHPGAHYRFSLFTKIALWSALIVSVCGFVLVAPIEMSAHTGVWSQTQAIANAANTDQITLSGGINGNATEIQQRIFGNASLFNAVDQLFFQSMSVRGAGFSANVNYLYSDGAKTILAILMFIGASPSSTAGGIRTTTIAVLFAAIWARLRGYKQTRIFSRAIPESTVSDASICFFLGVFLLIFLSCVTLSIMDDTGPIGAQYGFIDIFYELTSAFGTVGMTVGLSSQLTKIVEIPLFFVILLMIIGQLGLSNSVLVWAGRNPKGNLYSYPTEDLRIG